VRLRRRVRGERDGGHRRTARRDADALRAGATEGERAVDGAAIERLRAPLAEVARNAREPEEEVQYPLPDLWSLKLF